GSAALLNNSTLRLLRASVTLTSSSRNTRSSGDGRKFGTTLNLPSGSSVYLIFVPINVFALSPVTGSEYSDKAGSISEANGKDAASDSAEAEESRLVFAMLQVLGDYAMWIRKRQLRLSESDSVLQLILAVLDWIPIELRCRHWNITSGLYRKPYNYVSYHASPGYC